MSLVDDVKSRVVDDRDVDDLRVKDLHVNDDLHTRMKSGSADVHRQAETTNFVKHFISCSMTEDLYRVFLAQIYYVYRALEEEGEKNCDHDVFQAVYFPTELNRVVALEDDLDYFYRGSRWQDEIEILDVTKKYVDRIHEIGLNDPTLLVAHFYTRYLGDLSGGQILKYKLKKAFSLGSNDDERGMQFYVFPEITDVNKFKTLFKNRLNSLEADRETCDQIEREVVSAFQFNINLFEALDELAVATDGYTDN